MAINADTLLDRLYLKSQITKWRTLAVVCAIVALFAVGKHSIHSPIQTPYIARLNFEGVIGDDQKTYDLIKDVEENDKIKAVVLWLDTPGGSAVGGEEIFLRLRKLAEKKPVVAVMRSISASAGYMVALGADRIYAREGTITGSIGVLIETAEVTELAEKIGIKPVIIKSTPLKGSPSPFEKLSPEAEHSVRNVINDFYARFVDMVAERRGMQRERALSLADGRIYSGKAAVENKLIDAIGGEEEAVAWLVKEKHIKEGLDVKEVKPEPKTGLFNQFADSIAGKFLQGRSLGLDGLAAIWHPEYH